MTFTTQLRRRGDHAVRFSSDEHELVSSASDFLAAGLRRGASVLVAATAAHVEAFIGALGEAGLEPQLAQVRGQLTVLDADETLAGFLVDGRPDRDLFRSLVEPSVRRLAQDTGGLCIYGEMVAVLWDAGAVDAAVELEGLWNELGAEIDFSLLCGYRCTESADPTALARVCAQHTEIVGVAPVRDAGVPVQLASRTFDGNVLDARVARRFTIEALGASGHGDIAEDAAIVVTELAANAIAHARSRFTVKLWSQDGRVRIAVHDDSLDAPGIHAADDLESCGRGLRMVASIAEEWGAESGEHGKVVWAELTS